MKTPLTQPLTKTGIALLNSEFYQNSLVKQKVNRNQKRWRQLRPLFNLSLNRLLISQRIEQFKSDALF